MLVQKHKYQLGTKVPLDTSGTDLAMALGLRVYTPNLSPRRYKSNFVINWGCSYIPWLPLNYTILNMPSAVKNSSNKIESFRLLSDVPTPPWTTDKEVAKSWLIQGKRVVARAIISGSQGDGITIVKPGQELPLVLLYTQYISKKVEYRVHVVLGKVVHIQQKRRLSSEQLELRGLTDRNKYIRNLANGYIFSCNTDYTPDSDLYNNLVNYSISSLLALGLDFGGVDLIVDKDGGVWVLEVNSAPGLEGTTLEKYINKFKEVL